jgi:hypothetical protein
MTSQKIKIRLFIDIRDEIDILPKALIQYETQDSDRDIMTRHEHSDTDNVKNYFDTHPSLYRKPVSHP